jgi:prevent-host-death family protein
MMVEVISSSRFRTEIKRVLNEVGYGQKQYIIERFGEPAAAVISVEDYEVLQEVKQKKARKSLQETLEDIRRRARDLNPEELDALIEEARAEYHADQD